jgi:protein-disulfide isomerase
MSSYNHYLIPASIVIAGALIAGAVVFTSPVMAPGTTPITATSDTPSAVEISYDVDGFPVLGSADAPVTIVEYSDYNCPFCKRFVDETKPQIIAEYIDAGQVRFVRKDFIAVGGQKAAEAAHCAGEQGAYWEYSYELIAKQPTDRPRWEDPETHREYATRLGLNADALVNCFIAGTYTDKVNVSTQEAVANGASGTPFFIINDVPISGAQPYTVFKQVIDRALAAQS